MNNLVRGSCLCGVVSYKVSGPFGEIEHCHYVTCRKAHGSAFSSVAAVKDDRFELNGAEHLNYFESSEGKKRYFCEKCGTQIYAKRDGQAHVILRLGSLDDDPKTFERKHIWVSQKASWYNIAGDLPQHAEFE